MRAPGGRQLLRVGAVATAAAPLVWFATRAWSRGAYPVFDDALIALRIRDVLSTHPPLLGAGTSFGRIALEARANHPGPLPFFLLAPVWGLTGFRPGGLVLSLLLYHVAFLVLVAVLAVRVGGDRLLVLTLAAVLLVERAFGVDVFTRTFNPYLGVLPFLAVVLASWAAVVRSPWYLVVVAFAGSVAVQAQLAYAAPVAALGGVAALVCVVSAVRSRGGSSSAPLLRPLAVTAGVALVCWSLPLWQELTTDDGNLARLWDSVDTTRPTLGAERGSAVVWQLVGHLPPRLLDLNSFDLDGWLEPRLRAGHALRGAVVVVGLIALFVVVRRRSRVAATGLALALVAVASTTAFVPTFSSDTWQETYQFLWVWVVNGLVLIAVATAAIELLAPVVGPRLRGRAMARAVPAAAGVALVALAAAALPATYVPPVAALEDRHRGAIRTTLQELRAEDGPYLVTCIARSALDFCQALTVALEGDGIRTRQNTRATFLWGPDSDWRRAEPDERLPTLVVYSGFDAVSPMPEARLVSGPGTDAEERADAAAAVEALTEQPVVVTADDVPQLDAARFDAFAPRLPIMTSSTWFRGETADEWDELMRSDTTRFVEGGGLPVLADAGLLADRPELAAIAERWRERLRRDVVWLLPPAPPGDPFP